MGQPQRGAGVSVNRREAQGGNGRSLVILGLGNLLLTDDGVGVHAVRALGADPPPDAELVEAGTWVFEAQAAVERATELIAIDAIDMGQPPGTIGRFELDADRARPVPSSLHEFDSVGDDQVDASRPPATRRGAGHPA